MCMSLWICVIVCVYPSLQSAPISFVCSLTVIYMAEIMRDWVHWTCLWRTAPNISPLASKVFMIIMFYLLDFFFNTELSLDSYLQDQDPKTCWGEEWGGRGDTGIKPALTGAVRWTILMFKVWNASLDRTSEVGVVHTVSLIKINFSTCSLSEWKWMCRGQVRVCHWWSEFRSK